MLCGVLKDPHSPIIPNHHNLLLSLLILFTSIPQFSVFDQSNTLWSNLNSFTVALAYPSSLFFFRSSSGHWCWIPSFERHLWLIIISIFRQLAILLFFPLRSSLRLLYFLFIMLDLHILKLIKSIQNYHLMVRWHKSLEFMNFHLKHCLEFS